MTDLAVLYKALAEEPRLRILALLHRHGELCVCDVEVALAVSQSKASRHLRYLAAAGLVVDRREGVRMHYRIPPRLDEVRARILEGVRPFLDEEVRWREDEVRLQRWLVSKALAGGPETVGLG